MEFKRWGYDFDGAYPNCNSLSNKPGIYVIWCKENESWKVLDVGESEDVRKRVCNHDRYKCWQEHCNSTIYYSATYTPELDEDERKNIEKTIREVTDPPCGDR